MEEVLYLGLCLVNGIVKRIVVCEDNGMLIGGVDGILKEMLFIECGTFGKDGIRSVVRVIDACKGNLVKGIVKEVDVKE